jgi:hypothetical protein
MIGFVPSLDMAVCPIAVFIQGKALYNHPVFYQDFDIADSVPAVSFTPHGLHLLHYLIELVARSSVQVGQLHRGFVDDTFDEVKLILFIVYGLKDSVD